MKKEIVTLAIDSEIKQILLQEAFENDRTLSSQIRLILKKYIANKNNK